MTSGKRETAPYSPAETRPFRFGGISAASPTTDGAPIEIGVVIDGRYQITGLLGEGGMGRVYAAEHRFLRRRVALKMLRRDAQQSPESVARFRQEALLTTRIGHPGIVEVLDCATLADGRVFMVMEFLEGESFEAAIARPGPALPRLRWLADVASALAAAHKVGVVHRDIKPANLFLSIDRTGSTVPKILDFGIAKATEGSEVQTQAGSLLGTPYYLAPERALGQALDARTDLYSLGVILYEILTGDVPFVGVTLMEVIGQQIHATPLDPRQAAPERPIPAAIAELTLDLLAKDPADRPADGDLVASRLRGLIDDLGPALQALETGPRVALLPEEPTDRGAATVPPLAEDLDSATQKLTPPSPAIQVLSLPISATQTHFAAAVPANRATSSTRIRRLGPLLALAAIFVLIGIVLWSLSKSDTQPSAAQLSGTGSSTSNGGSTSSTGSTASTAATEATEATGTTASTASTGATEATASTTNTTAAPAATESTTSSAAPPTENTPIKPNKQPKRRPKKKPAPPTKDPPKTDPSTDAPTIKTDIYDD